MGDLGIQEIRILPMDKKEAFQTEQEVRAFLSHGLAEQDGKYYYRKRGIVLHKGHTLILFQYSNTIVGFGIIQNVVKQKYSEVLNGRTVEYHGYFQFIPESVHNIAQISWKELKEIDKNISAFSQAKQYIDIEHRNQIYGLLFKKQIAYLLS